MALSNGPNLGVLVDGGIGEVHYNALMQQWRAMDALVQPRVKSAVISTPPVSPVDGDCYIVPSGSSGVWSTHTNKIARYSSKATAWEYYTPKDGWVVHNEATSSFIKFNGTAWVDPIINKADLVDGKVPASQLPSYVDDILEFPDLASFPVTGESGKIYVAIDTGNGYRWSGSVYVKISQPLEEIPQATIEAGTDSGLFALTARRIRQAIAAWFAGVTNIDGKNIGATMAGTGRFTTLTTTGRVGVASSAGALTRVTIDTASDIGIDLFRSTAEAQFGGIRFRDSTNTTTRGQIGWSSNDVRYESTGNTLIIAEGAERARFNSTGLSVTGNLTATGNTTLGDGSSDTVTVNGPVGLGTAALSSQALRIVRTDLTGDAQHGIVNAVTGSAAATTLVQSFSSLPGTAAGAQTTAIVAGFHAYNVAKGAGSTITNAHGVLIDDQTAGVNNYGITSQVSAGANKRNLNITGTADNYLAGKLGLNTTIIPDALSLNGNITLGFNESPMIRQSTNDGADNSRIQLCGGGAAGVGRGGYINLHGNEHANHPGMCDILAGNSASGGSVRIYTDNTLLRFEVTRTGVVDVVSGQIKFPAAQNASAEANTLDDYEEGTFTPTIIGTTTSGTGTYTGQVGRYTKVGNRVFVSIAVAWTDHTGTGNIAIAGLPFATNATSGVIPVFAAYSNDLTYTGDLVAYAAPSQTQVTIGVNASGAPLGVVPMDTSAQIRISGHYEV